MNIEQARFNMIEQQIRPWDVLDTKVLALLATMRREQFVPSAMQALAFADTELPLGHGQTMLSPKLEARLLQAATPSASDTVLEIGTGSGYMAALLAQTAALVVTYERVPALAEVAKKNIHAALCDNVRVETGCGFELAGAADKSWDLIVLSGSVASAANLPASLIDSLAIGGRIIGVFGHAAVSPMLRALQLVKQADGSFAETFLFEAAAPALSGVKSNHFAF
jgi:protein-L-isoaspartate(D-aspartate) O-methyltransferase